VYLPLQCLVSCGQSLPVDWRLHADARYQSSLLTQRLLVKSWGKPLGNPPGHCAVHSQQLGGTQGRVLMSRWVVLLFCVLGPSASSLPLPRDNRRGNVGVEISHVVVFWVLTPYSLVLVGRDKT
jgi:hypothetical protein